MSRSSLPEIRDEDSDYDEKEDPAEILSQLFEFADTDFARNLGNYIYRSYRKIFTKSRIATAEGKRLSRMALISYLNKERRRRDLALDETEFDIDARDDIIEYYVLELIDRLGSQPLTESAAKSLSDLKQTLEDPYAWPYNYDVDDNLDDVLSFAFRPPSEIPVPVEEGGEEKNPCTLSNPWVYRCPKCDGYPDVVTQTPIPRGAGVCVDKACYDGRDRGDTLSAWLHRKPIVPHTNRRLTHRDFRSMLENPLIPPTCIRGG